MLARLKKCLDVDAYTPFIPRKAHAHTKSGAVQKKEIKICFPGYVFIRSQKRVEDSTHELQSSIYGINEAYYFLCYGNDKQDMALREDERVLLERLMNAEFCIDSSVGFMEGDCVNVISGPLDGIESRIIKINKQKRTAVIEVDMFGGKKQVTLMLEVLEKGQVPDTKTAPH